ncbi:MAG: PDZ domain-containing protein [Phycisphaerales bacterium]|nr:trypsin-like peptidase domain-containing protein [Phycisphaerae bacterium]NNM24672.1 PDZ domain-containing protein [Phycisphaerales bacterium]
MRRLNGYGPSLIVLVTAMAVLFLGPGVVQKLTYKQTEARMIQASLRLGEGNVLAQFNQAFDDIAALVEPSVVHINAQQPVADRRSMTSLSTGSGWIYDDEGYVVTNHHVVRDAGRIEVQLFTGELRDAEIVGFDQTTDIAVLKIPPGRLHSAERGSLADPIRQGHLVFAFGSPFDFRFSMSAGIVSGKGRHVDVLGRSGYENFIQVDAAINPGNSGGPLTDYRGRVIGMNTAIATGRRNSLEEGQFAGIGLAIPLDMIEPVVRQIIEKGYVEKGLLGVVPEELNVSGAQRFGFIGTGVLIGGVRGDGPAAAAGVRTYDIITHVNERKVSTTAQLRSIISSMEPGEVARLALYRPDLDNQTGERITIDVTLDRLDYLRDTGQLPPQQSRNHIRQLGIARMRTATEEDAARLDIPFRKGVTVEALVDGSELAEEIPVGTTIVTIMDYPVTDVDELLALLRSYNLRAGVSAGVVLPDGEYAKVLMRVQP